MEQAPRVSGNDRLEAHRWLLVADSEFLPAFNGGRRECLAIAEAAESQGLTAGLVLPLWDPSDTAAYTQLMPGARIYPVPRKRRPWTLLHPTRPYLESTRPVPAELAAKIRRDLPDLTGILVMSQKVAQFGAQLGAALGLPSVIRQHNLEADYYRSLAAGSRGPARLHYRLEARRIARTERALSEADWLAGMIDISAYDAATRRQRGQQSTYVGPFARDASLLTLARQRSAEPTVLFVGALDVPTNIDSVARLIPVLETARQTEPRLRLNVVGRNPGTAMRTLIANHSWVTLHADVPSVEPFLASAWVAVNPAITGSGVNIKLIDYLMAGVPVVTTSAATRGLELPAQETFLVADTEADFAAAVVECLTEGDRSEAMGARGREAINTALDPVEHLNKIAELMESGAARAV